MQSVFYLQYYREYRSVISIKHRTAVSNNCNSQLLKFISKPPQNWQN